MLLTDRCRDVSGRRQFRVYSFNSSFRICIGRTCGQAYIARRTKKPEIFLTISVVVAVVLYLICREYRKMMEFQINYNVKWPRKRNDRQQVTSKTSVCNTMTDGSLNFTFFFFVRLLARSFSPFSDGPDHENGTDRNTLKITHIRRRIQFFASLCSISLSISSIWLPCHSGLCGNNVLNCVCISHLSRSQWLCKRREN